MPGSIADSTTSSCLSPGRSHKSVSSSSQAKATGLKDRISVGVRLRPLSDIEKTRGEGTAFNADSKSICSSTDQFHFDHVFSHEATNEQVYEVAVADVVRSVSMGRSGAVLMYGATGSGKTWTMTGGNGDYGIVQRSVTDLFAALPAGNAPDASPAVSMSILEIYNEKLLDLLGPDQGRLDVRLATSSSTCNVAGLTQACVTSAHHAMSALSKGLANRKVRGTASNDNSSRSHTIVTITVRAKIAPADAVLSPRPPEHALEHEAVLHLVDLAGSESGRVTNDGDGRRESASINKSLLALGRVISALSEGVASHVNFRDSKLTRLLQPTLSGSGSKVAIICTATPAASQAHETRNTLEFGMRARKVKLPKNVPKPSTDKELIRHLQREVWELRAQLASQNIRQPCAARSYGEAAESQLSAESAAMSAMCQTLPLSLETASNADLSDESCGLPTPVQEDGSKHRAKCESRLNNMSAEGTTAQDITSLNSHSIRHWQEENRPVERTLEHMSAHARATQHSADQGSDYVNGWHDSSGLVGELDYQLSVANSADLDKYRCISEYASEASSHIRHLQHMDMEHVADDLLLELINALIEVMEKVRHVVEDRQQRLNANAGTVPGDAQDPILH